MKPRASKLVSGPGLATMVQERLDERLSPHAISAELAELGVFVFAEATYQACFDHTATGGLKPDTWSKLPRARRRRKPRNRCEQTNAALWATTSP